MVDGVAIPFWRVELEGEVEASVKVQNYRLIAETSYRTYAYCSLERECASLPQGQRLVGGAASVETQNESDQDKSCYVRLTDSPSDDVVAPNVEAKATFELGGTTLAFWYQVKGTGELQISRAHNVRVKSDVEMSEAIAGRVIPYNGTTIGQGAPASAFILK